MSYSYRSKTRWHVEGDRSQTAQDGGAARVLIIHVRFGEIDFETTHHIWFRDRPDNDGFWEAPLVLHELDHVLISSDRSLAHLFESKVKTLSRIEFPLATDESPSEALVKKIVASKMEAAFQAVSELAEIRYEELDQVTRHGREPLPQRLRESEWFTR